jgi:hypothetical protein
MASVRVATPLLHPDLDSAAVTTTPMMSPTTLPRLPDAAAAEETSPVVCFSPDAQAWVIPTSPLSSPALAKVSKDALVALPKSFMYN